VTFVASIFVSMSFECSGMDRSMVRVSIPSEK